MIVFDVLTIINTLIILSALYFAYKGYKKVQQPLKAMSDVGKMFNPVPEQEEVKEDGSS
jgi:hypothetical protein